MGDVAEILMLDPVLAARILRMANSAFYGFRSQVDTVTRAANILGMQKIHDLALAAGVSQAVQGLDNPLMDLSTFWYRSVSSGFLARQLASGTGLPNTESMFVRGLLQDIGRLLLFWRYPEESRLVLAEADQGLEARLLAEERFFGIDSYELAAELARFWQLPESFVDSFLLLMHPEEAEVLIAREIAMLHIVAQFTSGMDSDLLAEDLLQHIRAVVWHIADLPPEAGVAALDASSFEMVEAMYRILTPQAKAAA
jgi:HD-like signal output (HDOD) protein